ncbi:probable E3 ubiquitin-protein ligase MARCHF10 [Muntiacus reevesi]|uniref:probable E3 ubiquitin-protein ligase MARCHF10 n=1 Tax=Muntiacus reevesi TaxID=9886 RepID=UPI003307C223
MLHEAKDRQKFVSDIQYLRDMQHKVDSEYQACLRRQEHKRDPNEKKRDQFWGQETNFERSRFSSGSSSRQSSGDEDAQAEPRLSATSSACKTDSRLPAIDQTSVKQKHKSTMTPKKSEKAGPSKPPPAAQAPQILSRKRRPNLGRLTVSPEMQSRRLSGGRSRQKLQRPGTVPTLRGIDPIVQQEHPTWASDTKLKRPTRERRNLVPSSQVIMVMENTSTEGARKGDPSALSQSESHPALPQAFQGTHSPQELSESLGIPLAASTLRGPRRTTFQFRDEDFYSILSSNPGGENDDTEEETHMEEALLMAGMHLPRSPSSYKRSRFLGTLATQAKNKNSEENPAHCRANSMRSEASHGSLRISNAMEPVTEQSSVRQRISQNPGLSDGGSIKRKDSSDSESEKKASYSWDTQSEPSLEDDINAENVSYDGISMEERPWTHAYERDWQAYLSESSNPLDSFLAGRPTAPRSSMNLSHNMPGSVTHFTLRDDTLADPPPPSTLVPSSDSEGSSRFNGRQPLSSIRNRNLLAGAENCSYFPVDSAHELDVRGAEDVTSTSPSQETPLYTDNLLPNPQGNLSLMEPSRSSPSGMNAQAHLHVAGSLQENIPFTFFAVSEFPNQNENGSRMEFPGFSNAKGTPKMKTDPEKLKKIQESLLEEDSEEEGDLCRICQIAGGSLTNPLLEPCGCVGSLQFVHQECLKTWLKVKITSGADLGTVKTCEMCKQSLLVNLDDFNVTEFYQKHQQSRVQNELMNSGLYLVLLLHLYEQRFAELMRLNHNRVTRERLSRNYPQPRPEENESSELGDGSDSSICEGSSRVV